MKYVLTFVAAFFLVGVSTFPVDDLNLTALERDFLDFYYLIGFEKLEKVVHAHLSDPKLITDLEYLRTEEFHNLMYAVEELPEFQKYVLYLEESGYSMVKALQIFHKIYLLKPYVPPQALSQRFIREAGQGGLVGLIKDFMAQFPKKEIHELHEKKLKESSAFAKYSSYIRSDKYTQILEDLKAQETFARFIKETTAHGIDFLLIREVEMQLFGFK